MITAPINENQFGAFVSLAYNIGVGAFKRSSALKRFNAGEGDRVTEAIRMWKKAGGKTVQGLVNRREAEVALFLMPVETVIRPKARSTPTQSRTVQASVAQTASAVGGAVGAVNMLDGTAQIVALVGFFIVGALALFIMKERLKAWAAGWR